MTTDLSRRWCLDRRTVALEALGGLVMDGISPWVTKLQVTTREFFSRCQPKAGQGKMLVFAQYN